MEKSSHHKTHVVNSPGNILGGITGDQSISITIMGYGALRWYRLAKGPHEQVLPKNINMGFTLARLIVSDIGLGLSSHPWQWYRPTIDSGHEISALSTVLQKKSVRKFSNEFLRYILQSEEFSKCGRIFFRASFPNTDTSVYILRVRLW